MVKYEVELSVRFQREFKKLGKYTQKIIRSWINKNLEGTDELRLHGKGLTADRSGSAGTGAGAKARLV